MDRELTETVYAVIWIIKKVYPSIKIIFKGKPSLVRRIAALLPLRPAPRIHIFIPLCSTPYGSFYEDNYLPSMRKESSTFFGSVLSPKLSSTPETQRVKIQNLEKQLLELQQQVAKIIQQVPTSDYESQQSSVYTWLTNHSPSSEKHVQQHALVSTPSPFQQREPPLPSLPALTPPPPPPPPLPPLCFLTPKPKPRLLFTPAKRCDSVNSEDDSVDRKKSPTTLLSGVIQEITRKRPPLRPVKRSPGGNPLKTPKKNVDDPSDILSKVLRQRFLALHSDSMTDSFDDDASIKSSIHSEILPCTSSPASAV